MPQWGKLSCTCIRVETSLTESRRALGVRCQANEQYPTVNVEAPYRGQQGRFQDVSDCSDVV
jgi:hypothetical protein